jgi:hypothetical protein
VAEHYLGLDRADQRPSHAARALTLLFDTAWLAAQWPYLVLDRHEVRTVLHDVAATLLRR